MNFNRDADIKAFRKRLLDWFSEIRRPLPWRENPGLYKTVVSEFMLQQTQVATVVPYFNRWMERFPNFSTLAEAPEQDVLKAWEGLGYYSRARNLHKVAKAVAAANQPPQTESDWRSLPGIGLYTAAAIASIAQKQPVGVADGNVVRIFTRLTRDPVEYRDGPSAARAMKAMADRLVDRRQPGMFNEALMELGATVCRPRAPTCLICPIAKFCAAGPRGEAEDFPRMRARQTRQVTLHRIFAWDPDRQCILLERIPEDARRLAGQFQLPTLKAPPAADPFAIKKRGISNQRITEVIFRFNPGNLPEMAPLWSWVAADQIESIVINGPHRKWINSWLARKP